MSNEKIPARHFTRQQVIEYVARVYTGHDGNQVKVSEVVLLKGSARPIWVVNYWIMYSPGTQFESRFHSKAVITEFPRNNPERSWELCPAYDFELPEGCASVQEENAALRQKDEEDV
jgi:hypothetical protein